MTRKSKTLLLALCGVCWLLGAGCSGINASHSVSPIDFLIPGGGGLMRGLLYVPPPLPPAPQDPATPVTPPTETPKQVALAR